MDKKLEKQNGCLTSKSKKLTGFVLSLAISSSAAKEIIQFHFGHYLKKKMLDLSLSLCTQACNNSRGWAVVIRSVFVLTQAEHTDGENEAPQMFAHHLTAIL